ncbi:MAG TPA: FAD-linked oxidase C-terminal domain-containing protein, partial [Candidatus Methylomirabilis sp.]
SVPRSAIPAMVREIQRIAKEFDLPIVIFGHAGDGNLHPNILTDRRDHKEMERVEQAIAAIFEASVRLGGTLSGEHGIGLSKQPYMNLAVSKQTVKLMVDIKRAVDPKNILNPGKIWRA